MNKFFINIIKAGLIVGTLDISAAFLQFYIKTGKDPLKVLTFIASAVFGKAAFAGGDSMKLWGLLLHFGVAFSFTIFFFLIFPVLNRIIKNKLLIAILYAPFMWAMMEFVVLPLTKAPKLSFTFQSAMIAILILLICIAIPLSFMATNYYKKR